MGNRPIGIFDSGVGGLSVLLEIQNLLPNETFIFFADQAYVPYGKKTKDELVDRVSKIIEFFETKNVKAVVMACNTATVYTIEEMRAKYKVPIIGTVPVVKTLANISKTRVAAVFSTPGTAKSEYLTELIAKFAPNMEIIKVGGSNLEELVEEGDLESPQIKSILETELPPLLERNVDAIALGCTHYPFLRDQVERIVGPNVAVVDSGGAVARRLTTILVHNGILANEKSANEYYTTGDADRFHRVAEKLMAMQIPQAKHADLNFNWDDVGLDFGNWDDEKLWTLNEPITEIAITELSWHFDVPFWSNDKDERWTVTPQNVIDKIPGTIKEQAKVMHVALSYPIHVIESRERWLVLDGLHRLVKSFIMGDKTIKAVIVPRQRLPEVLNGEPIEMPK